MPRRTGRADGAAPAAGNPPWRLEILNFELKKWWDVVVRAMLPSGRGSEETCHRHELPRGLGQCHSGYRLL